MAAHAHLRCGACSAGFYLDRGGEHRSLLKRGAGEDVGTKVSAHGCIRTNKSNHCGGSCGIGLIEHHAAGRTAGRGVDHAGDVDDDVRHREAFLRSRDEIDAAFP